MAEVNQYVFDFKEVVEALLRKQGIHEGIWGIYIEFGLNAGNVNVGLTDEQLLPTAIVPIKRIGIQRFEKETSLSVDASKVNPHQKPIIAPKIKKS